MSWVLDGMRYLRGYTWWVTPEEEAEIELHASHRVVDITTTASERTTLYCETCQVQYTGGTVPKLSPV